MAKPWLSVIMPVYNGATYLHETLASIIMQNQPGIECIAIDDGSTDGSVDVLRSYQEDLDLKIIERSRIGNWVAVSNIALSSARGEFGCFLHQDDIWFKNRLARMKAALDSHPDIDFIVHATRFIDSEGKNLGIWRCPLPAAPTMVEQAVMLSRLIVQNFIAIPAPVFRIESAREIGGLDERLWYTADWDFWLKMAARSKSIYLPDTLAGFRIHEAAQTVQRSRNTVDFRDQQDIVLRRHLPLIEEIDPNAARIRSVARFSIEVNSTLADKLHSRKTAWGPLMISLVGLGPAGFWRYFRDSRIHERVRARLIARLLRN